MKDIEDLHYFQTLIIFIFKVIAMVAIMLVFLVAGKDRNFNFWPAGLVLTSSEWQCTGSDVPMTPNISVQDLCMQWTNKRVIKK